ncbi:MAG: hypothetical protein GC161_19340 [Planctomycetaceae bacterium]|nr:hypothetical protein [Planctomycetaceae bacterium]
MHHSNAALQAVLTLVVFLLGLGALREPEVVERPGARVAAGATLEDLAPLAGTWRGSIPGNTGEALVEEIWSEPLGDTIVGLFRWIAPGGSTSMVELLSIRAEPDGVVLRLLQRGATLEALGNRATAAEDGPVRGDAARELVLTGAHEGQWTFSARDATEEIQRVHYLREGAERLQIRVEFSEVSSRSPLRFELRRAPDQGPQDEK